MSSEDQKREYWLELAYLRQQMADLQTPAVRSEPQARTAEKTSAGVEQDPPMPAPPALSDVEGGAATGGTVGEGVTPLTKRTQSRKHRGYATERLVAKYWQQYGFPYAEVVRGQGSDLTGTGPVRCEVKARAGFNPLAWLRQAVGNARHNDVPCVVIRSNGQGPKDIDNWLVMTNHETWLRLLNEAGYGAGAE